MIVEFASELRPTEFVTAMQHWCQVVDDERRKRDPNAKFDQRFLELHRTFDGHSNVDGFLDQEAAALVERRTREDHGATRPAQRPVAATYRAATTRRRARRHGPRVTRATRHAGGHVPAHVDAVLHVNDALDHDLLTRNVERQRPGASDVVGPRDRAQRRREIFGRGHTINGKPAARHDSSNGSAATPAIARVVMAGDSPKILDLGRSRRFPTAAQFRALVLRDRHCQFPRL